MFHLPAILIPAVIRVASNWLNKPSHHPSTEPPPTPPPEPASGIEQLVHSLAPQPGIRLDRIKNNQCAFFVAQHEGVSYRVMFLLIGDNCLLSVFGNILFPAGCVPPGVRKQISDMNANVGEEVFNTLDVHGGTRITVDGGGAISASEVTPDRFATAVHQMTRTLASLEDALVRQGYHPREVGRCS